MKIPQKYNIKTLIELVTQGVLTIREAFEQSGLTAAEFAAETGWRIEEEEELSL